MKSTIIGWPELRAGRKIKSDESPRFPASFSIFLDTLIVAKKKPELNDHPSGTILSYWSPHLTSSKRMKKEAQMNSKGSHIYIDQFFFFQKQSFPKFHIHF